MISVFSGSLMSAMGLLQFENVRDPSRISSRLRHGFLFSMMRWFTGWLLYMGSQLPAMYIFTMTSRLRRRLAFGDLIDILHAVHDLAENGVRAVEMRRVREADEELAVGAVGIARTRCAESAALERGRRKLSRKIGILGAALAGALRVAGLGHEARDDAMELQAVVEALGHELLDARDVLRRQIGPQPDRDLAGLELHDEGIGRIVRRWRRSFRARRRPEPGSTVRAGSCCRPRARIAGRRRSDISIAP